MTIKHLFPLAWPKLDLNFAAERTLDPRITFTRSSTGTYMDATGILRYAAEDEPRFDHSGTGKSLGLLIEEFRTNHLPYSDLTNALEEYDCDNSPSTEVNPEGVASCRRILAEASNGEHRLGEYYGGISSESSVSVFVKMDTHPYVLIGTGGGGSSYTAAFNIDPAFTGDRLLGESGKGTFTNLGAGYESYANGWFRIWASGTSAGTAGWGVTLSPDENTFNINSWTATGTEAIFAYGGQYEYAKFPTSYIATNGAEVDRELDLCEILETNFSSWFNNPAGTFSLEARTIINGPNWFFGTGLVTKANEQQINMYQGDSATTGSRRLATGMANASVIELTENVTDSFKAAVGYEYSIGRSASYNGGTAIASNVSNITPNYLTIGSRTRPISGGSEWPGGQSWIARLSYYPRRLSDEQLQALTA